MASGQIRMTPDTMRERAGEYRTEADNVQSVIDKMDRLLDTLLTEWEGSASEAYANKFAELRPSFVKGKELIDDIAMALDKTAEAVESTDTQIANQFSMYNSFNAGFHTTGCGVELYCICIVALFQEQQSCF